MDVVRLTPHQAREFHVSIQGVTMTDNIDDIKEYYATGYDETTRLERHQLEHEIRTTVYSSA